jgi:hypothetical protein
VRIGIALVVVAACGVPQRSARDPSLTPPREPDVSGPLVALPPPPADPGPAERAHTPKLTSAQQALVDDCRRAAPQWGQQYYTVEELPDRYTFVYDQHASVNGDQKGVGIEMVKTAGPPVIGLTHPAGPQVTIEDPDATTALAPMGQAACYRRSRGFGYWTSDMHSYTLMFAGGDASEIHLAIGGLTTHQVGNKVELVDARGEPMFTMRAAMWGKTDPVELHVGSTAKDRTRIDGRGPRGPAVFAIIIEGVTWRAAGDPFARYAHTLTLLRDGRALLAGGGSHIGMAGNGEPNASREPDKSMSAIFDPKTDTWTPGPPPNGGPRMFHQAVALADGRVLIVGGQGDSSAPAIPEMFAPRTSSWVLAGRLSDPDRTEHAAVLLADGRVLVAGGRAAANAMVRGAQLFDPTHLTWKAAADMLRPHAGLTLTLLADGRVLAVGKTAELYDPRSDRWVAAAAPATPRWNHAAVRLHDGRVLVAGGRTADGPLASAELYDPRSDRWTPLAPMATPHDKPAILQLASGRVLVAGGVEPNAFRAGRVELFDLTRNRWDVGPPYEHWRGEDVRLVQLADGDVLLVGGSREPNLPGAIRCGHACGFDRSPSD